MHFLLFFLSPGYFVWFSNFLLCIIFFFICLFSLSFWLFFHCFYFPYFLFYIFLPFFKQVLPLPLVNKKIEFCKIGNWLEINGHDKEQFRILGSEKFRFGIVRDEIGFQVLGWNFLSLRHVTEKVDLLWDALSLKIFYCIKFLVLSFSTIE